ncbi:hypothetical protein [Mucilaginibacter pocheonensis]|uniref:Uncharacterized protein n=1 Tax=Mucilaginibacter pocheonensis TaxID=398050 RepID=A0ABU1THR9_9SPHI|nr:hypothetical protein [Mucilaginibacter pocheonensis]MDR6944923.1 hypothetical protein [Mucilaginibacter pocheonensis]
MKPADKHYKFINSRTGNVIYYHSISGNRSVEEIKAELQEVKNRVAIQNNIYCETVYWEEMKEDIDV